MATKLACPVRPTGLKFRDYRRRGAGSGREILSVSHALTARFHDARSGFGWSQRAGSRSQTSRDERRCRRAALGKPRTFTCEFGLTKSSATRRVRLKRVTRTLDASPCLRAHLRVRHGLGSPPGALGRRRERRLGRGRRSGSGAAGTSAGSGGIAGSAGMS